MKIGYMRVSTEEQTHKRQQDSLASVCDKIYTETISAANKKRPVFEKVLRKLKRGDTLVVHDLDRAFRSTIDALSHAERLQKRGISFQILSLHVDPNTPAGQLVYTVMAAFAQYERQCLSQRTKEGMAAAKRRGKHVGRPFKLKLEQIEYARDMLNTTNITPEELADELECNITTLQKALKR